MLYQRHGLSRLRLLYVHVEPIHDRADEGHVDKGVTEAPHIPAKGQRRGRRQRSFCVSEWTRRHRAVAAVPLVSGVSDNDHRRILADGFVLIETPLRVLPAVGGLICFRPRFVT